MKRRNRRVVAKEHLYHIFFTVHEDGIEISSHYRFCYYYDINYIQIKDKLESSVDLKEEQYIMIKSITKVN